MVPENFEFNQTSTVESRTAWRLASLFKNTTKRLNIEVVNVLPNLFLMRSNLHLKYT